MIAQVKSLGESLKMISRSSKVKYLGEGVNNVKMSEGAKNYVKMKLSMSIFQKLSFKVKFNGLSSFFRHFFRKNFYTYSFTGII